MNDRWQQWLYEPHPKSTLAAWASRLRFFRFCRAYGGHANDGDELLLAIRIDSERDLESVFIQLGVPLAQLPQDNPTPVIGMKYSYEDFKKFRTPVKDYPKFEQPGHIQIGGSKAFAWVHLGRIEIAITDPENSYEVTDSAVEAARSVERLIAPLSNLVVDPPRDNRHCICPKYYPELWSPMA